VKRWGRLLLLAALTCAGCYWPGMGGRPDIARLAKEDALKTQSLPPPDVKPTEVNETNFRDKLKQLDAEIAHDEMMAP
jgi:hypothetical protein